MDELKDVILAMSELRLATNNFSEDNLMKQTPSVVLYKGQLIQSGQSIPIVVRRYTNPHVSFNEAMISVIKIHKNIATLFKVASEELAYDDDDFEDLDEDTRVKVMSKGYLIYKYEVNESLDKHLSGSTLTWMQRLNICVDVARALCFIHNELDDGDNVIHGNIKSSKIWLNQNWEPTLHGLRLDMAVKKHGVHHPNNYDGTLQYTDPAYEKTKALSHKSDVYSFGVVLFEVLLGRVASIPISDDEDNWSFARFARSHYERKTLGDIIDPVLRQQMDSQSVKNFSETAYYCLLESRSQRPDMVKVVKRLEKALDLQQKHESPEHSTTAAVEAPLSDQLKGKNLDHLRISLSDIRSATDNFSETCRIGKGGYGTVYKAELHHFDGSHSSTTEGVKKDNRLHISLKDIQLATQNFSDDTCIEEGRYWKQYEGQIPLANANEHTTVIVKRFDNKFDEGRKRFLTEIKVLVEFKHKNIIALVGYCTEMDERIICYEHATNGSFSKYVQDASLTWIQRIKICIDMASGLSFLHKEDDVYGMIHSDIKSGSILLDAEWNAKISNLELASRYYNYEEWKHDGDDYGSLGFMDPTRKVYVEKESDWYSFSRILLEMFCGRFAKDLEPWSFYQDTFDRCASIEDFINQVAFEGIKEQISAKSCDIFFKVALYCAENKDDWLVIARLEKALEAQEDHEIWEPKLPGDYQKILESSKIEKDHEIWDRDEYGELDSSEIEVRKYSKKRWYELLCKGILLKEGTTWLSLWSNRRINEMISARKFVFKKSGLRSWRSTPESRFPKVAVMFIISDLKIKIRTQFLSLGVNYGVHLVFKFCGPRKSSSKPSYVNLTYKMRKETLHAYFATWRDEDWMMIELGQFLNHKKDTNFEVLLESFSKYYCERNGIYIEGIEFRAIHDVNNEESVKIEVQQILESNTDMVQVQQLTTDSEKISKRSSNDDEGEKALSLNEVNEKKHLMLSAKQVLYDSSKEKCVKLFHLKPLEEQSRFQEVIELLPRQVFSLKCKIQSQMLSQDTNYICYLVFKLSEKCHGLHCPVKVRDVLHWKNKEIGILYFRIPSPWNIHDNHRVPKKREDGWMEVIVWKFNSTSNLRNEYIPMHLKLVAYEGTMSGLTVGGLEIRPI